MLLASHLEESGAAIRRFYHQLHGFLILLARGERQQKAIVSFFALKSCSFRAGDSLGIAFSASLIMLWFNKILPRAVVALALNSARLARARSIKFAVHAGGSASDRCRVQSRARSSIILFGSQCRWLDPSSGTTFRRNRLFNKENTSVATGACEPEHLHGHARREVLQICM
jgi:hypothetical protein